MAKTPLREELLNEREARKNRRADYRFHVYVSRLTLNLLPLEGVGDLLRSRVHIALTARCETHSRFVARLEVAERAYVEEEEERQPPHQRRVDVDEKSGDQDCGYQGRDAEHQPFSPLSSSNVRRTCRRRRRVHRRPRPYGRRPSLRDGLQPAKLSRMNLIRQGARMRRNFHSLSAGFLIEADHVPRRILEPCGHLARVPADWLHQLPSLRQN